VTLFLAVPFFLVMDSDMNLDRLESIRGGKREVITKLMKEIDRLLVGEPKDIGRLQVIYEQLKNKLTVLQKLDDDILTLLRERRYCT